MNRLSVIILTKNEALNIEACLNSVAFADECIVFDCGSQDETVSLARKAGAAVVETNWPGESTQRNRALAEATGEWILMLDADERVSDELKTSIQTILKTPLDKNVDVFDIAFQSYYLGKAIQFGDWRGERHPRLFKKGKAQYSSESVHCRLLFEGKKGLIKDKIHHYSFPDLETVLDKMNRYSSEGAKTRLAQGKKGSLGVALSRGIWRFVYGFIFKLGFLDGSAGFLLALSNAEGSFYRYVKLSLLQKQGK